MYQQLLNLAFPERIEAKRRYDRNYRKRVALEKDNKPCKEYAPRVDVEALLRERERLEVEALLKEKEDSTNELKEIRERIARADVIGRVAAMEMRLVKKRKRRAPVELTGGVGVGEDVHEVVPEDELDGAGLVDDV